MTEPLTTWDGFWSYVHADDHAENGKITSLAEDVTSQYELLTGERINLFLDKNSLEWGEQWKKKVDEGLGSVAFFIAVITPRYFMSAECRRELQAFARKSSQLGIRELVLPLLYVDVSALRDDSPDDDLVNLIKQYQWEDWRELRFEEPDSKAYRKAVSRLAERLQEANRKSESMMIVAPIERPAEPHGDDSETAPGTLDRLAEWEDIAPVMQKTLEDITAHIQEVGAIMNEANQEIGQRSNQGQTFAHRLIITRLAASKLQHPADELLALGNNFATQLHLYDIGVRTLVEVVGSDPDCNTDDKTEICRLFESLLTLSSSAKEGLGSLQSMIDQITPLEKISRDLRPPLRGLRRALTLLLEGIEITDSWVSLIEQCPIQC
jgi:hypothetical protein